MIRENGKNIVVDRDEGIRETTLENLEKIKTCF